MATDAMTKLADGERLLAAWRTTRSVEDFDQFTNWWERHAPSLLAGMRALIEMTRNYPYEVPRHYQIEAAQDAIAQFTKEATDV